MQMTFSKKHKTLIAHIAGELDQHAAKEIRQRLDAELERGFLNLLFDLSALTFMDSAGIGVIIGRFKNVQAAGGQVLLAGAGPQVQRVLKISGIEKLIRLYATVDEALQAL